MLNYVRNQAYKLEFLKNWRIHDVFIVLLLEQDTTRKGRVHEENAEELDAGNDSKKYKVEVIRDSAVYAKKLESGYLPGLYYLAS